MKIICLVECEYLVRGAMFCIAVAFLKKKLNSNVCTFIRVLIEASGENKLVGSSTEYENVSFTQRHLLHREQIGNYISAS